MKTLSQSAYGEIQNWMHRCCRPLEIAMWRCHFEDGPKEDLACAISYFQNEDGGFGKLIDADNWNMASTPYGVFHAIRILRSVNFTDIRHPVYQGAIRYLENTEDRSEYGYDFTVPDNDKSPHAVWWSYDRESNKVQNLGITAALAGFMLRYAKNGSKAYGIAASYTGYLTDSLKTQNRLGDVGLKGYISLLDDLEATGIFHLFDLDLLRARTAQLVNEAVRLESDNFMTHPSEFITGHDSRYYKGNEQYVEKELDGIIGSRPEGGVWEIPWEWYNGNQNPKEFTISELWAKAAVTISNMLYLRNFGRLRQ